MCDLHSFELHLVYREQEADSGVSRDCLRGHPEINQRSRQLLVEWLEEVREEYNIRVETLYLAVNLIDRYVTATVGLKLVRFQLVGVAGFLLASKYNDQIHVSAQQLSEATSNAYRPCEVVTMEMVMTKVLGYKIGMPTVCTFLHQYLDIWGRFTKQLGGTRGEDVRAFASYIAKQVLQSYRFLEYNPSTVAAACTSLGLLLAGNGSWNIALQRHTGFKTDLFEECSRAIVFQMAQMMDNRGPRGFVERFAMYTRVKGGGGGRTGREFSSSDQQVTSTVVVIK